ncbi:hypothetical protein AAHA92_01252 [Salvia divinorum]|uniref:Uncharacterized protein n=1 Tax=Salvia divinorum TaxID=28513 RepID=A0ABD1IND7_SALDI
MMDIPLQGHYVYNGKWHPKMDTVLANTILRLKEEMGWKQHEFPSYFLMVLALCYRTFKEVVAHKGMCWDRRDEFILATDCVWTRILKDNAFTAAYYYHDELEYNLAFTAAYYYHDELGHFLNRHRPRWEALYSV